MVLKDSVFWKWGDKIQSEEKCSLNEIEKYMEDNINHIERCIFSSYYVVYRTLNNKEEKKYIFKYVKTCLEQEALNFYEQAKDKYNIAAIYFNGKIIKKNIKNDYEYSNTILNKYVSGLDTFSEYCKICTVPEK